MKKLIVAALVAAFAAFVWWSLPAPPQAEPASGGHANHAGDPGALSDGTVLAVDRTAMNVTISHGPLVNLGMPPMTMGYEVADPVILEGIKPGDKVRFHADVVGGAFTVMSIEPAN